MENLKIFTSAVGRISVATPFSREFIAAARSISGHWDAPAKVWTFDSRDRERLSDGVVKISGEFSRSGGSIARPRVCPGGCQPVMLEIRDIPRESLGAERDLEWALVSTYPAAIKATCDPEWRAIHLGSSRLTSYL